MFMALVVIPVPRTPSVCVGKAALPQGLPFKFTTVEVLVIRG